MSEDNQPRTPEEEAEEKRRREVSEKLKRMWEPREGETPPDEM
jgi:hypothetical protein